MGLPSGMDGSLNKSYRKYRSECSIVSNMLEIIARHSGIKKTPLMNFMNMNNTSFKSYKAMLEDAGLIEKRSNGRNEELVITGAGNLLLNLMGAFKCLYNYDRWRARRLAEKYARQLAEDGGWHVVKDEDLVDYVVEGPNGVKIGIVGAVCEERSAALLARIVKLLTDLNNVVVVRMPGGYEAAGPPRLSRPSKDVIIVSIGVEERGDLLERLQQIVVGEALEG